MAWMIPTPKSRQGAGALAGGRVTIDLAALADNWRSLDRLAPGAETAAVVKADGYGVGAEAAVRALAAAGCRTFFVALPDEGLTARRAAPDAVIYILNGVFEGAEETLAKADLRPVLGSWPEIEAWAAFRPGGAKPSAAIHIDTGMNRLGLTLHEALALARRPDLLGAIGPSLVMSHLACADTPDHPLNQAQLALFGEIRREFAGIPASLANSAGTLLGGDFHFDLVRPGIGLYGAAAMTGVPPLRTVVTLEARVIQVREAEAGETVGYGATERLKRPSRLALLSVGYADGYHRTASSSDEKPGARAQLRGRMAPLVGRVSMDLIAIDATDLPVVHRGDWAELFGPNSPVDEVAAAAGTIGYELLTGLGGRCERRYVGGPE